MDATQLIHIRKRLEVLFGLNTFIRKFQDEEQVVDKFLKESDALPKPQLKEGVIAQEVLKLLDQRWVSVADTEVIPGKMGVPEDLLAIRIYVLNQVLEAYRKIPDQYFKESDHRENVLEAVQEALDDLIEQEEAEEMGEEFDDEDEDDDDLDFDF